MDHKNGYSHGNFAAIERRENQKRKNNQIDETIKSIDLDGFKSLFSATTFCGKIFWLSLLIFCITILIYQLYQTISDYITSPTISTFTIKTNDTLDFPVLYLCPASMISQAYLNHTSSGEQHATIFKREMAAVWDYTEYLATGNLSADFESSNEDELRRMSAVTQLGHVDLQDFWLKAAEPLDENFVHCEFRSFTFHPLNCSDIAKEVLDPEYGKCYVIDVGDLNQAVEGQGLQFVFNVRSHNYPTSPELAPVFNGVYMSVLHEFNPSSGDSILLTPGTFTRIDLAAQFQSFMNQPGQDQPCVLTNATDGDDDDSNEDGAPQINFVVFNANYSQTTCKYDCVAREIANICNCLPPTDRSLYLDSALNSTEGFCRYKDLKCIKEQVHGNSSVTDRIDNCRSQCNVPCNDWRYDVRTTSMNLYQVGFDPSQPVNDIIYVTVAFSHMEFSVYTQAPSMQIDDLVANLGGQIGLWLGGSMMTLIQIPLFLCAFCGVKAMQTTKKLPIKRGQTVTPTK